MSEKLTSRSVDAVSGDILSTWDSTLADPPSI